MIPPPPGPKKNGSTRIYDLALAAAFEPEEGAEPASYSLYERIAAALDERLGKKTFLPHRDTDWQQITTQELNSIVQGIIPTVDLVLCYSGIPSTAAGMMMEKARANSVPAIIFWERGRANGCNAMRVLPDIITEIEFGGEAEAVEGVVSAVEDFYRRSTN